MMHPNTYVAQTVTSDANHFYKAIMDANEYEGPAVINVYTTCQPEHGVADELAQQQAGLAKDTRTFPVFIYDPRKGETTRERLSLKGNPNMNADWYINPKTKEPMDFITFARTEGRFRRNFNEDGSPSEALLKSNMERLRYWRTLQDLAGIERKKTEVKPNQQVTHANDRG